MRKKTEIKCNGMMLTAGFHAANPPLIWRFDLERNHSFTLALQGEEGDWDLGLTSPKGDFHSIVHFLAREDAEEAFAKIEDVLAQKRGVMRYIGKALLIVVILALLIILSVSLFAHHVSHSADTSLSRSTTIYGLQIPGMSSTAAPAQPGMPESADEVLQPPQ